MTTEQATYWTRKIINQTGLKLKMIDDDNTCKSKAIEIGVFNALTTKTRESGVRYIVARHGPEVWLIAFYYGCELATDNGFIAAHFPVAPFKSHQHGLLMYAKFVESLVTLVCPEAFKSGTCNLELPGIDKS